MFHKWRRGMPLRFSTIPHNSITATCSFKEDLKKSKFRDVKREIMQNLQVSVRNITFNFCGTESQKI